VKEIPMNRRHFLAALPASALATGAVAAAAPRGRLPRPRMGPGYFPNVVLRTQDGKSVRFYDDLIRDKIVVINMMYARCDGSCPATTSNLVQLQRLLGDRVGRDIFMYSVTLKPEEDTPDVLQKYMKKFNARPEGWTFLTGQGMDIENLRKGLGFTYPDPAIDRDKTQHIGNVRYGNEPLMLWAACPGMAHPPFIAESISWMIRPETKAAIARG